jgi:DNA-binding NarL/FixJ family response regulator
MNKRLEASMMGARVFVADSHEIVRIGIKSLLTQCGGYQICGEAANGRATVEQTLQLSPDVVVLDVVLPCLNGIEAARKILARCPHTCVLFFTDTQSEEIMRETLQLGIRSFVSKSDRMCDLLNAVDTVLHGGAFFTSRVTQMFLHVAKENGRRGVLNPRERELVQLIAEGHCTKHIARMLSLSVKTIETHRCNLMRKLDIHSTVQLILYAIKSGIVDIHTIALRSIEPEEFGQPRLGGGDSRQLIGSTAA